MKTPIRLEELRVCGVKLHALQPEDALAIVRRWVESERSFHYVSSTNVNNVAIAIESPEYFRVIENADLSLVDGYLFLWYGRMKGFPLKKRSGIEGLMEVVFETSIYGSRSHYFYGNTPKVLESLKDRVASAISQPANCWHVLASFQTSHVPGRRGAYQDDQWFGSRLPMGEPGLPETGTVALRPPA